MCLCAGVDNEFVFVGRLDNLGSSFCALQALLDCYPEDDSLQGESAIKAVALFDHEEVGSASAQGEGWLHSMELMHTPLPYQENMDGTAIPMGLS